MTDKESDHEVQTFTNRCQTYPEDQVDQKDLQWEPVGENQPEAHLPGHEEVKVGEDQTHPMHPLADSVTRWALDWSPQGKSGEFETDLEKK